MKLQCIGTSRNLNLFLIGKTYEAEDVGDGTIRILQDELVSDFESRDAWIARGYRDVTDGKIVIAIRGVAKFREVQA